MRSINWTDKSLQSFKRIIRKDQYAITKFKPRLARTLRQLQKDPFHPNLKTHKLIGDLSDVWSCSVDGYDHNKCQILFEFIQGTEPENIHVFHLIYTGSVPYSVGKNNSTYG